MALLVLVQEGLFVMASTAHTCWCPLMDILVTSGRPCVWTDRPVTAFVDTLATCCPSAVGALCRVVTFFLCEKIQLHDDNFSNDAVAIAVADDEANPCRT